MSSKADPIIPICYPALYESIIKLVRFTREAIAQLLDSLSELFCVCKTNRYTNLYYRRIFRDTVINVIKLLQKLSNCENTL